MNPMKVISLIQPWASLMAIELKRNETRSWDTKYRGPLLIHASKKMVPLWKVFADCTLEQRADIYKILADASIDGDPAHLPQGAIISKCNLIDTKPTEILLPNLNWLERACGDYSPGRFGWITDGMEILPEPIPVKGKLGLWNYEFA